jgi:hypothetical protein
MELSDALKILTARRHFEDLDLALGFVGCVRLGAAADEVARSPDPPPVASPEEDDWSQSAENVLPRARVDGWSMAADRDLDAATRQAERREIATPLPSDTSDAAGDTEAVAITPEVIRDRTRRAAQDQPRDGFIVPMLLEPVEDEAEDLGGVPAYRSVALRRNSPQSRARATNSVINPRTAMTTMHSLLERPAQSSQIDVDALVRRLSLLLPITDTPRLSRDMAVPPMHLLYDTSLLIGPYAEDLQQLVWLARALFGEEVLEIRAFRKSLHGGCGRGPIWTWTPFRFPAHPATMMFISGSFGADLEARVRELEEIIKELEKRGHHGQVLWLGAPPIQDPSMARSWRILLS